MMTIILGILAYFIIGGIVLGIVSMINDDKDDTDSIGVIGILWPISVPIFIGLAIIAIVYVPIKIIAGFFIKNKKH